MRKTMLVTASLLAFNVAIGFAAPLNNLNQGQTAVGFDSDTFYVEHKINDNFTIGYQDIDRDNAGSMDDIYGQFNLNSNLRGIVGNRSFHSEDKVYLGLGINQPLSSETDGYASIIAGSEFKEFQLGANIKLSRNADLNINYHSFQPDGASHKSGVALGATFKF